MKTTLKKSQASAAATRKGRRAAHGSAAWVSVSMELWQMWNGQKPSILSVNGMPAKLTTRRKVMSNGQPMMTFYFKAQQNVPISEPRL